MQIFTRTRLVTSSLLLLGILLLPAQSPPGQPEFLRGFWSDPQFVERFLGSYGFAGSEEPTITAQERDLLRRLVELIPEDLAAAAALLERSLRPDSSAALDFTLGNLYFQLDRYDAAQQSYEVAVGKFPGFLRAHKNLGMVLVQQEELEAALAALTRALQMGGADAATYGLVGYCHLQLERPVSAEPAYRQALLFEAANSNWKLGLARCLQLQDRQREAAALLGELAEQSPERADILLFQANAFIALKETDRAARNLELVRRMNAATPEALLTLGDIYLNEELVDLAVGAFLQALTEAPERAVSRVLRAAEGLAQRERAAEAKELLGALAGVEHELSAADHLRRQRIQARLALAQNDPVEATAILEQLLSESPLDGEALLLLARAQTQMGDPERAELTLQRAAEQRDFTAAAYRQQGELHVGKRRFSQALDLLRQAQALEPRPYVAAYIEQVERLARMQADNP